MNKNNFLNLITSKFVVCFTLILPFFISCNQDLNIDPEIDISKTEVTDQVSLKNGYLHFKDAEAFSEVTSLICNMTDEERQTWEDEHGFLSQRRIMLEIIDAEDQFEKQCITKYNGVDVSDLPDSLFRSPLYKKYLSKNVIKEIDKGTEDQYYDLSIYNRSMIDFVNADGFFAIGDSLFHVNDERLALVANGSFNEQDLKISTVFRTLNDVEIIEYKSTLKAANWRSPGWIYPLDSNGLRDEFKVEGKQRIGLKVFLSVKLFIESSSRYEFYHDVHVQIQKKNWRGKWKYETTGVWLDGNWGIDIFKHYYHLNNSFTWQGNASYLKVSVNPETGSTAPYQSYFSVSAPIPDAADILYSPVYTNYYWEATRWGGAAGITKIMQD